MIAKHINSNDPKAAIVQFSIFDDLGLLIPLHPLTQKAWRSRATPNRGEKVFKPELN